MDGFVEWASRHMSLFRLDTTEGSADARMVESWEEVFAMRGYDAAEMRAATDRLAAAGKRLWPGDHLDSLTAAVAALRREAHAREKAELDRRYDTHGGTLREFCEFCRGPGIATVPLLASVNAATGEWDGKHSSGVRYSCGVSCRCPRGEQIAASHREAAKAPGGRERKVLMRLADYEAANPNWRAQLEWREREQIALAKAKTLAVAADRVKPLSMEDYSRAMPVGKGVTDVEPLARKPALKVYGEGEGDG